jgi:hypothetical protein
VAAQVGGNGGTAVTLDGTQTLTNKTLTSPTLTTPVASTTIGVGAATASASGAGITFPATQSASTNANTLDDYEEGTWTPADGSGAGLSFTIGFAKYTKIGNQVSVTAQVTYPATASTANANMSGLPFTNTTPNQPASTLSTNAGAQKAIVRDTFISVYPVNSTTDSTNVTLSASTIFVSAVYLI